MSNTKDVCLDEFFLKTFDENNYNCAHFASDVWERITDLPTVRDKLLPLLQPLSTKSAPLSIGKRFIKLKEPQEPCIVVMHRKGSGPHVGVFLSNKVLHITTVRVEFVPLRIAMLTFDTVGFYR